MAFGRLIHRLCMVIGSFSLGIAGMHIRLRLPTRDDRVSGRILQTVVHESTFPRLH
jgi:hypothetical protein